MTASKNFNGPNTHCVLTGKESVIIENRPIPKCGADQVLVKVMATGICGSDLSYYKNGGIGTSVVKKPLVLGHESSGEIYQVGENVSGLKVGDRVAIEPALPCRVCRYCKDGKFNCCMNDTYMASPPTDGTLCQWYSCPAINAVKIPDSVSWKASGCLQPLAIAIHLARRCGLRAHQNVVVTGCGPLGLLCMAVAKAYGARTITAIDVSESRLAFAKSYVATHTHLSVARPAGKDTMEWNREVSASIVQQLGTDVGPDLVIEASGQEAPQQLGITMLRYGGTYCQAGMGPALTNFPALQIATKELNVVGTLRYTTRAFEDGMDLIERGLLDLEPLITKTFPIAQSEDAFKTVKAGTEIKIVIMNQE